MRQGTREDVILSEPQVITSEKGVLPTYSFVKFTVVLGFTYESETT